MLETENISSLRSQYDRSRNKDSEIAEESELYQTIYQQDSKLKFLFQKNCDPREMGIFQGGYMVTVQLHRCRLLNCPYLFFAS